MTKRPPKRPPKRPLWLILPLLVFAGFVVAGMFGLSRDRTDIVQHNGKMVPAFSLSIVDVEKGELTDRKLTAANVQGDLRYDFILVNFFASWCAPCAVEMEFLQTLDMPRFAIVGIAYKDKLPKTLVFLQKNGNPYRDVAMDDAGMTAIEWGMTGVPESFLLDARGRILKSHAGPLTADIWARDFAPLMEGGIK